MKPPAADTGRALADWLLSRGGRLGAATVSRRGGLRGLHATRDIAAGDLVLMVPRALFFSRHTACDTAPGRQLARVPGLSDLALVGACLAHERRRRGRWAPLVDAMPTSFRDRPDGWARADWDLLKGSHAQVRARHGWRGLLGEHELVRSALAPADALSLREFAWGYLAACTRAFGLQIDGAQFAAVVPMADMLNHAVESNCETNGEHGEAFELRATRNVRAGEALTISYGELANTSLLARYGFCLADNPHDRATLCLRFDESHWMHAASVVTNGGEAVRELCIGRDPLDAHGLRLFTFFRLEAMSRERAHQEPALQSAESAGHLPVLDADNELRALARLADECERRLAQFADAVDKDDTLLSTARLAPAQRSAITVRRGEKRLLIQTIGQARRAAAALRLDGEQRIGALQACVADGGTWCDYFRRLVEQLTRAPAARAAAGSAA